jgi:hypothetical protein
MDVAANALARPIADLTNDTPLDSDDLDFVAVELSLAGIEVNRHGVETVGDLIERIRPTAAMMPPSENALALRQADQARTDFALIERHLQLLSYQLSRVPTRAYLCRVLLVITASVWALLAVLLLR